MRRAARGNGAIALALGVALLLIGCETVETEAAQATTLVRADECHHRAEVTHWDYEMTYPPRQPGEIATEWEDLGSHAPLDDAVRTEISTENVRQFVYRDNGELIAVLTVERLPNGWFLESVVNCS